MPATYTRPSQARVKGHKTPLGFVAYCDLCKWSSPIMCGDTPQSSQELADNKLKEHCKSARHKLTRRKGLLYGLESGV